MTELQPIEISEDELHHFSELDLKIFNIWNEKIKKVGGSQNGFGVSAEV